MPLRDRLVEWIAPGQTARLSELETDLSRTRDQARVLRDSLETFADVLRDEIVTVRSPREMIAELQESGLDDGLLQQLVYQIGWDQIGALSGAGDDSKQERSVAVEQAVRLFRYSPLAQ
jgi:CHAD domain-containing protein